ncbi:hypothetical protein [Algicola sagamiensis]|uniref:hypothetical protein n=1 Tax=Algicola sagamiensis TaxID=163869 RepID=UPI0012F858B7|nr:hypothetical protein [Algicola sagamiensis]
MSIMRIVCYLTAFVLFTPLLRAEQINFNLERDKNTTEFNYHWRDGKGTEHQIGFVMDNEVLYGTFRHFKAYRQSAAQRFVLKQLREISSTFDPRDIRVQLSLTQAGIQVEASSVDEESSLAVLQTLRKAQQESFDEFLKNNYFSPYIDPFGVEGVNPDHGRFAAESIELLKPIKEAFKKKYGRIRSKKMLSIVLSFVQSIPYHDQVSEADKNAGFIPPNKLLYRNLGDCDSKSTLFASLAKAMYPKLGVAMIYIPNHTLVGLQIAHVGQDQWINHNGIHYILAEPVGPELLPMAKVADSSESYVFGKMYRVEKVKRPKRKRK